MNDRIAFVIMQIGNPELDKIYSEIIIPSIEASNLVPKRIDRDNGGNLLKKEIIEYIERAEIIIADLTNERPNCYLEIGYAMGLDKYKNLIFTVREDHYSESKNHTKGGPKVHFDVTGYDILFWDADKLEDFKVSLTDKINRRLSIITPNRKTIEKPLWDADWLKSQRDYVSTKLKEFGFVRQMEILISPVSDELNVQQRELLSIADESQIDTFGWPIGVIFKNVPELRPISKTDGIISEISGNPTSNSYDYTYFRKNGQIFIARSFFEDPNFKNSIIPEVRIKRLTELLMYVSRFYLRCKLPENEKIEICVRHLGLLDNTLHFTNWEFQRISKVSKENESIGKIVTSISEIETKLPELVRDLLGNLLILFDFYEIDYGYLKSIVDKFVVDTKNAWR